MPVRIQPRHLFFSRILDFEVKTKKLGKTRYVNLDNAATTPPLSSVELAVNNMMASYGSVHRGSGEKSKISTEAYEKSRETIKHFINAPKDAYVLFTNNTTGGMNTAAYFFSFLTGKIAVSQIEHSASWLPWIKAEGIKALGTTSYSLAEMDKTNKKIQTEGRKHVIQYDVNNEGIFDLKQIENLLQKNTVKAFVLTASSNLTGYCPPIKKIGALVHKYNAYFIVDACQFIQHHPIDMKTMGIDFLVASGHKFYAPYGGGFLIGPKKFLDKFLPYQIGGGNLPYITEQKEFLRYETQLAHDPGTPNAIGAITMATALSTLQELGMKNIELYEKKLTERAYTALENNPRVLLHVSKKHLSTVIPFTIKGMDSAAVAERLNTDYGIGVRAGSFCVYHLVRKLLRITDEKNIIASVKNGTPKIPSIIRASFSLCNSDADVTRFIHAINEITI